MNKFTLFIVSGKNPPCRTSTRWIEIVFGIDLAFLEPGEIPARRARPLSMRRAGQIRSASRAVLDCIAVIHSHGVGAAARPARALRPRCTDTPDRAPAPQCTET